MYSGRDNEKNEKVRVIFEATSNRLPRVTGGGLAMAVLPRRTGKMAERAGKEEEKGG